MNAYGDVIGSDGRVLAGARSAARPADDERGLAGSNTTEIGAVRRD